MQTGKTKQRPLNVKEAAAFISEHYAEVSPRSFARFDIPYRVVLKRRVFDVNDLVKWAERKFAAAPRRIGKTS